MKYQALKNVLLFHEGGFEIFDVLMVRVIWLDDKSQMKELDGELRLLSHLCLGAMAQLSNILNKQYVFMGLGTNLITAYWEAVFLF